MAFFAPMIVSYFATSFFTTVLASTILGTIVGTIVGQVIGGLIGQVVSGLLTSVFSDDKQEQSQSATAVAARESGQTITINAVDEPIPVPYGFANNIPALIVYRDVSADKQYLYLICLIGEGPIEAIDAIRLDDVLHDDAKFSGVLTVETHLGADGQAASTLLASEQPGKWSTADIGGNLAYVVMKLTKSNAAYPGGEPRIAFDVRGRKIKDTRDGVTRFQNNPALCIRDYWTNTRYGRRVSEARMADAKISAEASYFEEREVVPELAKTFTANASTDVITVAEDTPFDNGDGLELSSDGTLPAGLVAATKYFYIKLTPTTGKLATTYANALARVAIDITDAGTGVHTADHIDQVRYHCNGLLDPSVNPYDNLAALRSACRSWFFEAAGQYHLIADKPWTAGYETWNEDNIVGSWNIDLGGEDARYNRTLARFLDSHKDNQPNFAVSDNTTERADDGGKLLEGNLKLDYTTNAYIAQRIAQIERRKSRLGIKVMHTVTIEGLKSFCGDVIKHTHSTPGWVDKKFRILGLKPKNNDEVEAELAEYSDAIWALDEQTVMPLPVRTNLPDPGDLDPPGITSVVEVKYETTGSAGVKTKAVVTWMASTNPWVSDGGHYDVEFKEANDTVWQRTPPLNVTEVTIVDIAPGRYSFRNRAVTHLGHISDWSAIYEKDIVGLSDTPADATSFAVRVVSGEMHVTLDQSPDLDVRIGGRLYLRWSPLTSGATWNDGSIISPDGWPGDSVDFKAPLLGTGSYMAKFKDSSGNWSENAVTSVLTDAQLTTFNTLVTITEHPTFTGAKTNVATVENGIQLTGATLWDDMGLIDGVGMIDSEGGINTTGVYEFANGIDLGSVKTVRLFPHLKSLAFDTTDDWDSRTTNIDTWGLIDGSVIEDADVQIEVRTTPDDPSGSPVWGAWHSLPGQADYTARGFEFRTQHWSDNPTHNRKVSELSIVAKEPA